MSKFIEVALFNALRFAFSPYFFLSAFNFAVMWAERNRARAWTETPWWAEPKMLEISVLFMVGPNGPSTGQAHFGNGSYFFRKMDSIFRA